MQPRNLALGFVVLLAAVAMLAVVSVRVFGYDPGATQRPGGFQVTIYPQRPIAPAPESTLAAPALTDAAPAPLQPTPVPTTRAAQYVVQANDTLWDIALRFGFASLDPLLAANPELNPDLLAIGEVLNVPGVDFIPPPRSAAQIADAPQNNTAASAAGATGRVRQDAGGLRLRREPVVADNIITKLGPLTDVRIVGRSADSAWLQIVTPANTTGWVQAQYVDTSATNTSAASLTTLPVAGDANSVRVLTAVNVDVPPYLSDMSPRVYEIYRVGQTRGNQPNKFALIGDSNTENPKFFRPFDWGMYNLGGYGYLEDTIRFFKGSFDRTSPAARGGFSTAKALDPGHAGAGCDGETPVACELRLQRPSVALVLIGTGDQHSWQGFEGRYRQIIDLCIAYGVVPILITKGDDLEHRDNSAPSGYINSVIRRVAAEYQVPLLNLTQVLGQIPAGGFREDGFHYNWPPDERPADFTPDKLQYGFNQRNLTALQALDLFRRRVIGQ